MPFILPVRVVTRYLLSRKRRTRPIVVLGDDVAPQLRSVVRNSGSFVGQAAAIAPAPAVDGRAGCTDLDCCRSRRSHSEVVN